MLDTREKPGDSNKKEAAQTETGSGPGLTAPPTISLPNGGGAIRGMGEKFAANPVTGTGAMSVPIATSPGRSGFGPQLSLSYDSGAGNGPFGFGWNLSLPSITRKTDKGLPRYQDAADSDVFILSGAEDLVPEFRKGARSDEWAKSPDGNFLREEVLRDGYFVRRYRPRIEGLFARIERWTSQTNQKDVFWRSISRDNVTTFYGKTRESRIADPSDESKIFSWLICESYDDKGNAILYSYKPEDDKDVDRTQPNERNRTRGATQYLKSIRYGNTASQVDPIFGTREAWKQSTKWLFEIIFDYGEHNEKSPQPDDSGKWFCRHDPFSSYRAGFEVRTYRLCQRVLMFHHFPEEGGIGNDCLVKSTDFVYRNSRGDATDLKQGHPIASFIASVSQSGYKRKAGGGYLKKSLPPVEFTYSEAIINEDVQEIESIDNLPQGLDGSRYQWVDLDGEGLSGVLTEQGGAWFYKRNLSALPVAESDGQSTIAARFAPAERLPTIPSPAKLSGGQQLLDLAGDGQLDVVEFDGPISGFFERTANEGWETFRSFASLPNIAWKDPNLKFVDLTGDGHADILITEDEVLTWYPSLAEEGFGPADKVRRSFDEEMGPRLVFADGTQSIYLSDFSGDGLTDLVRIRNGEVCYWPNLGYGRFGAKVTMDHAPWFDTPDQFDQKRIRLADIDGSGVVDIIYLAADGVRLYFNQSGNRWSEARLISNFPPVDNLSSVQVADLLGNGTACLVWSSPLPDDAQRPMRYIDLMGGQKPHLLINTVNNLGATTQIDYAASTRFYLQDKAAGKPWVTKLPFPVHLVEKVTVTDKWRHTKFSNTYSYHHGYFDGIEREFRGFGRVEQIDTEDYGTFADGNRGSPYITDDQTLYQPPIKTISWFHTGAFLDKERILSHYKDEYFPGWIEASGADEPTAFRENDLPEPDLAQQDLTSEEWREALRVCKGIMLRQEVYELDVAALHTRHEQLPVKLFSTAYHNCHIQRLQPKADNLHAVFLVTESEAITYHYELDLRAELVIPDPRITHSLNLNVDDFGNVLQAVAVVYRRLGHHSDHSLNDEQLAAIRRVQNEQHLAYSETRFTGVLPANLVDDNRVPVPCEVLSYELTGIGPEDEDDRVTADSRDNRYFTIDELRSYRLSSYHQKSDPQLVEVEKKDYHELPNGTSPQKRIVEHVRMLFFRDDLTGPLDFRQPGRLGLPYETYTLALTESLLDRVFATRLDHVTAGAGSAGAAVDTPGISGYLSGALLAARFSPEATTGEYWMSSGIAGFNADAPRHFYLPEKYTDPFGNVTTLAYDGKYDLFIQSSTDALGNRTGVFVPDQNMAARFDYRLLAPIELEDVNANRSEAYFDVLGRVIAVAVKGKEAEADDLDGYDDELANPELSQVLSHFDIPLPADDLRNLFSPMLGNATIRFLYHFGEKIENGKIVWSNRPAGACAIAREQHTASLAPGDRPGPLQIAFECSDGIGTVLMKRSQAEPEKAGGPMRWLVSGKTVLNNKGKPVKQYEPYFSASASCCAEGDVHEEVGVTPLMYYDGPGRLVRTEMPDGTLSRVEFSPWHVTSFDANDTVKSSRWYRERLTVAERKVDPRTAVADEERKALIASTEEKRAARLAAVHSETPSLVILDSLGRDVIAIAHNRIEDANGPIEFDGRHWRDDHYLTFTKLDAEGKPLWIRDARGNLVVQYITPTKPARATDEPVKTAIEAMPTTSVPCYDIAGNLLFQHSMDAGDRWMLTDAAGKPMFTWDFNERQNEKNKFVGEQRFYVTEYDALHRPVAQWLSVNDGAREMIERFEYRDTKNAADTLNPQLAADQSANLIGQLVRHYDPTGLTETVRRDFKGNVLEVERRLNNEPTASLIDWQGEPPTLLAKLAADTFRQLTEYDALNRMTLHYNWHREPGTVAAYEPKYNRRGALQSEKLRVRASRTAAGPVGGVNTVQADEIQEIRYNAKGQKTFLKLGNGAITHYEYDPRTFRLRQLRTTRLAAGQVDPDFPGFASNLSDARVLQQLHYTYDPVGNVTEIYDEAYEPVFFQNQQVEPRSRYEYDALYRLISATGRENGALRGAPTNVEGSPVAAQFPIQSADPNALRNYTQTYRYDSVGNVERIHHEAGIGTWTRDYAYAFDDPAQPASNRLWQTWTGGDRATATTYEHDPHGNMLNLARTDPRFNMRWDHRDMIRSIDLGGGGWAYYQYDAGKQRTRKRIERNGSGVEERIYLGGYELYRRTVAGVVVEEIESHHLFEGKERVLLVDDVLKTNRIRADGTLFKTDPILRYQYSNLLGSACLELDHQAEIVSYEEYHPYGTSAYRAVKKGIEAPPKRYRFTGMERDEESGLSYHHKRYYCPWLLRWASGDPIGVAGGENLYAYCGGSPVDRVDATGELWWILLLLIAGVTLKHGDPAQDMAMMGGSAAPAGVALLAGYGAGMSLSDAKTADDKLSTLPPQSSVERDSFEQSRKDSLISAGVNVGMGLAAGVGPSRRTVPQPNKPTPGNLSPPATQPKLPTPEPVALQPKQLATLVEKINAPEIAATPNKPAKTSDVMSKRADMAARKEPMGPGEEAAQLEASLAKKKVTELLEQQPDLRAVLEDARLESGALKSAVPPIQENIPGVRESHLDSVAQELLREPGPQLPEELGKAVRDLRTATDAATRMRQIERNRPRPRWSLE